MSNLSNFLPDVLPGREVTLEDLRVGDPVIVSATNEIVVGLFDSADFTADGVIIFVVKNNEDDVTYFAADSSVSAISARLLDEPMSLSDLIGVHMSFVVHHELIGRTGIWSVDDALLARDVIGYVGYGYGEDGDIRLALDKKPADDYQIPDAYALLEIVQ